MDGEIDYNQVFGLEDDAGDGGSTPPPEGAEGGQDAGDQARDTADNGAGAGNQPEEDAGTGGDAGAGKEAPDAKDGVTGRQRARNAQGGEDTGRGGADVETVLKGLGITDPYTGKPIATKEEYDAYRERVYQERRRFILDKTGMPEAEIDDFISSAPQVRRATEDSARARELMESERRRQARERVDAEVKKISAMDPGIKSVADLTAGEKYPEMLELVKRGYDLSDAWKLANFERLQGAAQAASRQAAINSGAGRAGLQVTRGRGEGNDTVPVPKDVLEMYRALNPEMTDAEIRADYNKYAKILN